MIDKKNVSIKIEYILLAILILSTLGIRTYLALKTPNFAGNDAYFNIRQTENILKTGKPIYNDELSYSGRTYVFSPVYHYVLAGFSIFMPVETAAKIVPNILAAILIYIIYLMCLEITKNWKAAIIAATAAAFTPIFFSKTINNAAAEPFILTLFFLGLYLFIKIKDNINYLYYFIAAMTVLIATHSAAVILIISLLAAFGLLKIEKIKIDKAETEALLFITLLAAWFYAITYKEAFIYHGTTIIWQNIPPQIIQKYFSGTNIIEALSKIGIIIFILGLHTAYKTVFEGKTKEDHQITGITIIIAGMIWLRLIMPELGLMILGMLLAILFSIYAKNFLIDVTKTKIEKHKNWLITGFLLLIMASSIIPALVYANKELKNSLTKEEADALKWLQKNTNKNAVILAPLEEGHFITGIAKRKNVIDNHFIMIRNSEEIYEDTLNAYTSPWITTTVHILNKYEVSYIYVSDRMMEKYRIPQNKFEDASCFKKVFSNSKARIYEQSCMVKEFEI